LGNILGDFFTNSSGHSVYDAKLSLPEETCKRCAPSRRWGPASADPGHTMTSTAYRSLKSSEQGCQMIHFHNRNPNLKIFLGPWNGTV
jgi:hypothetical protein